MYYILILLFRTHQRSIGSIVSVNCSIRINELENVQRSDYTTAESETWVVSLHKSGENGEWANATRPELAVDEEQWIETTRNESRATTRELCDNTRTVRKHEEQCDNTRTVQQRESSDNTSGTTTQCMNKNELWWIKWTELKMKSEHWIMNGLRAESRAIFNNLGKCGGGGFFATFLISWKQK